MTNSTFTHEELLPFIDWDCIIYPKKEPRCMGCDPYTELCIDDGLDYTVISDGFDWELTASILYGLCFTLPAFLPLLTYLISSLFRTWGDLKFHWILASVGLAVLFGIPYGLLWPFAYLSKGVVSFIIFDTDYLALFVFIIMGFLIELP